jgi:hypothetical protein
MERVKETTNKFSKKEVDTSIYRSRMELTIFGI